MEVNNFILKQINIKNKTFIVPVHNLYNCEPYFLPKLQNSSTVNVYYDNKDLNELYIQNKLDPNQLPCNMKYDAFQIPKQQLILQKQKQNEDQQVSQQKPISRKISEQIKVVKKKPKLNESGPTHFINIPVHEQFQQAYINIISQQIDPGDLDILVPLLSLHITILKFRLKQENDLPKWQQVLKSVKRNKLFIKGVDIFPIKNNITKILFLNVKGLDDIIDRVISKAIMLGLINENQLQNISFDKKTQTYKKDKPHITILKTKGKDLIDATDYLQILNKFKITKMNIYDIKLSIIDSFDGQDYYNQYCLKI